jgi:hypothetical protein
MCSTHEPVSTTKVVVDALACSEPWQLPNVAHDSSAHLNMANSPVWRSNAPSAEILQKHEAARVAFLRSEGVLVLKRPVGSGDYVRAHMVNKVDELRPHMQVLGEVQDTQAALLILRLSIGVCSVVFLHRTLPQPLVEEPATAFEGLMHGTMASICCVGLADRIWNAARLPISTPDCPGLGFHTVYPACCASEIHQRRQKYGVQASTRNCPPGLFLDRSCQVDVR